MEEIPSAILMRMGNGQLVDIMTVMRISVEEFDGREFVAVRLINPDILEMHKEPTVFEDMLSLVDTRHEAAFQRRGFYELGVCGGETTRILKLRNYEKDARKRERLSYDMMTQLFHCLQAREEPSNPVAKQRQRRE